MVEGQPSLLIEHVAETIAASVLTEHRGVLGICVAVKKPHVAIPGIFNTMGKMLCPSRQLVCRILLFKLPTSDDIAKTDSNL